jgi:site-specific recombinase XerD
VELPPLAATCTHIELYWAWMDERGLAPSTLDRRLSTVCGSYRFAHIDGRTNIEDLGFERGHRILRIVGTGNKPAGIPLVPRTARTVDLAIGERSQGPILLCRNGERLDTRTAYRCVRAIGVHAGLDRVHPHMLRAAFMMAALDAGVPGATTCRSPPATPIPAPPLSTTAGARTTTVTPPTSSSPSSPAADRLATVVRLPSLSEKAAARPPEAR